MLSDGKGIPLALVVAGANRNDMNVMAATLDAIVIPRPEPTETAPQNLCEDKGYDFDECRRAATDRGYTPHIRSRGEEQRERKEHTDYQPRRWVVEVLHSWMNRFRKVLIRFEELESSALALLEFACAYIVLKRAKTF